MNSTNYLKKMMTRAAVTASVMCLILARPVTATSENYWQGYMKEILGKDCPKKSALRTRSAKALGLQVQFHLGEKVDAKKSPTRSIHGRYNLPYSRTWIGMYPERMTYAQLCEWGTLDPMRGPMYDCKSIRDYQDRFEENRSKEANLVQWSRKVLTNLANRRDLFFRKKHKNTCTVYFNLKMNYQDHSRGVESAAWQARIAKSMEFTQFWGGKVRSPDKYPKILKIYRRTKPHKPHKGSEYFDLRDGLGLEPIAIKFQYADDAPETTGANPLSGQDKAPANDGCRRRRMLHKLRSNVEASR